MMKLTKRTEGWAALLSAEARPTHRVTDIQGSVCSSAKTLLLMKLVSPIPGTHFLTVLGG